MAHPYAKKQEMHPGRKMAEKRYGTAHKVQEFARGGRAKNSKTNININIHAGKEEPQLPPMPMPIPRAPMAPPPGLEPGGGGGPSPMPMPPGMPQMQRGGKVKMKGGSESGPGRLDKIKAYGLKPKK